MVLRRFGDALATLSRSSTALAMLWRWYPLSPHGGREARKFPHSRFRYLPLPLHRASIIVRTPHTIRKIFETGRGLVRLGPCVWKIFGGLEVLTPNGSREADTTLPVSTLPKRKGEADTTLPSLEQCGFAMVALLLVLLLELGVFLLLSCVNQTRHLSFPLPLSLSPSPTLPLVTYPVPLPLSSLLFIFFSLLLSPSFSSLSSLSFLLLLHRLVQVLV